MQDLFAFLEHHNAKPMMDLPCEFQAKPCAQRNSQEVFWTKLFIVIVVMERD